ncbi:MAG: hypothetical protein JXB85_00995 [Anaerolineales bacterium]|nr:hypothetical protein [Anaerolineales bacterium]
MPQIARKVPCNIRGIQLTACFTEEHLVLVCFDELCQTLGLNPGYQHRQIRANMVYADHLFLCSTESPYKDTLRKRRKLFLDMKALPFWLMNTNAGHVKEEHRDAIISIKEELADLAWQINRDRVLPPEFLENYPQA